MNNKNILPAVFFQIGDWVTSSKGKINITKSEEPIMLCKDLSGENLFIKFCYFKEDGNPDTSEIDEFFEKKQKQMVNDKEILKVKNYLEESSEIEEEIETLEMSRKEEREWLKKKAEKIVLENWKISKGKWMRGAISSTKDKVEFEGEQYTLYESKTIIYDGNKDPSKSGLYYITKNRHSIPVMVNNINDGGNVFLNKNVATIDNFKSLLNHSIRTAKKNIDFLPLFYTRDDKWKPICNSINKFKAEKSYKRYIDGCNYILDNSDDDIVDIIFISLPNSLKKSFNHDLLLSDSNSMVNAVMNGVERIYYRGEEDEDKKEALMREFGENFRSPENIYGFYDIVSIGDTIEGNTYGFLTNNLNPRKIFFDVKTIGSNIHSLLE